MKGVRTWREFAAACVLAVMALGGASGPALAEVVARPSGQAGALTLHGPVLFYGDRAGNRSVVHRRELATGADRIVYRAPPGMLVTRLEAGGGTLGVGLQGSGAREDALTRVVALSAAGGSARNLAAGRYAEFRRRRCGTVAELFDVGPDGTVVFQNVRRNRPCGGRVGGDVFTASLRSPRARIALRGRSSQRGGALRDAFLGARVGGVRVPGRPADGDLRGGRRRLRGTPLRGARRGGRAVSRLAGRPAGRGARARRIGRTGACPVDRS